uniref:Uncharacterized protein n=1 Tax=Arundo donax TaxID=35708 RepID=A0A0A9EEG6_ARUDO
MHATPSSADQSKLKCPPRRTLSPDPMLHYLPRRPLTPLASTSNKLNDLQPPRINTQLVACVLLP